MLQCRMICSRITEGDIIKSNFTLPVGFVFHRLGTVINDRFRMKYFINTICCHTGTGQENGNHGHHHKGHDNHHGIGNECHHIAYLQAAGFNALAAKPDNGNCHCVHGEHHGGHHKVHDPVGKQLGTHQIGIGTGKPFFFPFFPAEGTDGHNTGENFTADQIQPIYQRLHHFEFRHRNPHQCTDDCKNHADSHHNNPAQSGLGTIHLQNTTNGTNRCKQHHAQNHDTYHLYLLDIIGAAGNQGSGGELIHFDTGELQYPSKNLIPQLASYTGTHTAGNQTDNHGCRQP